MLSKTDIFRELGKGICIFPLDTDNVKENSLNLCASKFAWATTSADIFVCENESDKNLRFSLTSTSKHNKKITINKGNSAVLSDNKDHTYIILLPFSTTLIETQEVLALGDNIGGTYHSKVGLVAKGLGHIGTMVGPNFSGNSLIAIHNVSNDLIVIRAGESFVSVVFHYLDTPYSKINPTISGHTDKFSELGLHISEEQANELNEDWKKDYSKVQKKMLQSSQYKELKKELTEQSIKRFTGFLNFKNFIIIVVAVAILFGIYTIANIADKNLDSPVWVDRFWNVGFSGLLITILSPIIKLFKDNSK